MCVFSFSPPVKPVESLALCYKSTTLHINLLYKQRASCFLLTVADTSKRSDEEYIQYLYECVVRNHSLCVTVCHSQMIPQTTACFLSIQCCPIRFHLLLRPARIYLRTVAPPRALCSNRNESPHTKKEHHYVHLPRTLAINTLVLDLYVSHHLAYHACTTVIASRCNCVPSTDTRLTQIYPLPP